ncbi:MAG TPA: HupE/UreJ family protein [Rubrivivax sp.]|nr:HupE/UreJ family protein [Rubrivivax sp.]
MTAWLRSVLLRADLALLGSCALLSGAQGHELTMAEMEMREIAPGQFTWQWTGSGSRSPASELTPLWPSGCSADLNQLRCGAGGLKGQLSIDGVGKRFSAALVKIYWLDGQMRVYTLTKGQGKVQLFGSANDERGLGEIAWSYTTLGIDHILTGLDHLLFVLALLFLVGFNRQLVWTITAFTVAHSLTLGLSAMGWLALRSPPVEAVIALSIVLVAAEALHRRETLARRLPALVAFAFGLIHGLGFAGAIKDIGLPEQHVLLALLTFNLGVEIGQLLMVFAAWVLWRVLDKLPRLDQARTVALYAMGALAAYWSWLRVAAILGVWAR